MRIEKFVEQYNANKTNGKTHNDLVRSVVTTEYANVATKKALIQATLRRLCFNTSGEFINDYIQRKVGFYVSCVSLYTNLEFSGLDGYEVYDLLKQHGILTKIIDYIGKDFKEYHDFFFSTWEQMKQDYYSPTVFVERVIDKLSDKIINTVENVDTDALTGLLDGLKNSAKEQT